MKSREEILSKTIKMWPKNQDIWLKNQEKWRVLKWISSLTVGAARSNALHLGATKSGGFSPPVQPDVVRIWKFPTGTKIGLGLRKIVFWLRKIGFWLRKIVFWVRTIGLGLRKMVPDLSPVLSPHSLARSISGIIGILENITRSNFYGNAPPCGSILVGADAVRFTVHWRTASGLRTLKG